MGSKVVDYSGSAQTFSDLDISPSDETGLDSIMYVEGRGLPWWQTIGSKDAGQFKVRVLQDKLNAEEALEASGTAWKIKQVAMSYRFAGKHHLAPRHIANIREDTGALLGVVSPTYKVIQNAEAFAFADSLVDSGDAKYETAGALFGGRIVVLSMELDAIKGIRVAGEREEGEVHTYLVLVNSHDGSRNLTSMVTPVRWVCKNTLNLTFKHHRGIYRIRHSGTIEGKIAAAREALGISFQYMAEFKQMADHLQTQQIVDAQVREIFEKLWPKTEAQLERSSETTSDRALENYHASETMDGIRGTKWGVLNAVAEFVDFELAHKPRVYSAADIRAESILWGSRAEVKDRALALLTGKR